jgi:hypothetical protein
MRQARLFGTMAVSLILAGCATAPTSSPVQSPNYSTREYNDYDLGKVVSVEQWARDKGARVIWIHYPPKKGDDGG